MFVITDFDADKEKKGVNLQPQERKSMVQLTTRGSGVLEDRRQPIQRVSSVSPLEGLLPPFAFGLLDRSDCCVLTMSLSMLLRIIRSPPRCSVYGDIAR